ncbi:hypothetical protein PybrP1_000727 [[Pythium] brassicae (nom. inval.)]|nr:hypothetical protein PybrP1_000727 [[Pythium] brassicae (nom. inval.)]
MTYQEELEKLQTQIHTRTEETTAYLASLKGKLAEFDEQNKVSEQASAYFQAGIAQANASVDELKAFGSKLQAQSKDASAELVESAKGAFDKLGASLEELRKNGEAYDEKAKTSLASAVEGAKEGLSGAATTVSGLVSATREKAAAGFEALKDQFAAAQKALSEQASSVADTVEGAAEMVADKAGDLKDAAADKASDVKDAVVDKAGDVKDAVVDKAEDIKDAAADKTEDVKEGSHTLLENATEFVHHAVDYVSETLHNVKVSATEAFSGNGSTTMADTTHQVDRLKRQIDAGVDETKSYLDTEYDEEHPNAQKATEYLGTDIGKAHASVEELVRVSKKLSNKSKDTSDLSMELAKSALINVKESLDAIQHTAHEYDAKFLNSSGARVSVEGVVNSSRQRSTDVMEIASEQLMRMKDAMQNAANSAAISVGHGAHIAAGEALLVGEKIDEKLGASEKASSAAGKVTETVTNFDKRIHASETAAMIDSKVTGGRGASVVNKGVEMVQDSIEYVTETVQQAKNAATKSGIAQAVDEKASWAIDGVSATAGAARDKMMSTQGASDATTKASEKAGAVKEGVKQKATKAKEMASQKTDSMTEDTQGMAGDMQAKGAHGKETMEQAAHSAKQTAAEKAGAAHESMAGDSQQTGGDSVMNKGVEMAQGSIAFVTEAFQQAKDAAIKSDTVQAKAGTAKEGVKQKATEAKEGAQEMAGSAQETGNQKTDSMTEGAQEMAGSAQETASRKMGTVKEGVKQKAAEASKVASEKASSTKEGAQEMAGSTQEKARQTKVGQGKERMPTEKAGVAQEGARSMAGTAQQRGGEAKQAVEQTAHGAVEKAKDVGIGAKEAAMSMASGESATDERRKQADHGGEGKSGVEKVKVTTTDTTPHNKVRTKKSTQA